MLALAASATDKMLTLQRGQRECHLKSQTAPRDGLCPRDDRDMRERMRMRCLFRMHVEIYATMLILYLNPERAEFCSCRSEASSSGYPGPKPVNHSIYTDKSSDWNSNSLPGTFAIPFHQNNDQTAHRLPFLWPAQPLSP